MGMDYKDMFTLAKGILLRCLKGEPVSDSNLTIAIHNIELAIDKAFVSGKPTNELEEMKAELQTISKAIWYAHGGE